MQQFYNQVILFTVFSTFPLLRHIFIREQITIVHGHSVCTPHPPTSYEIAKFLLSPQVLCSRRGVVHTTDTSVHTGGGLSYVVLLCN